MLDPDENLSLFDPLVRRVDIKIEKIEGQLDQVNRY